MIPSYLTPEEAADRLTEYGLEPAEVLATELQVVSNDLDREHTFVGERYVEGQLREFPRNITLPGDTDNAVPSDVLDWVAITAYELHNDDEAPVKQERIDTVTTAWTRGVKSRASRLKKNLLRPYLASAGACEIVAADDSLRYEGAYDPNWWIRGRYVTGY